MILLKGKGKSKIIDISNNELDSMLKSWIDDMQMSNALVALSDEQFAANVNIPEGQTIGLIRGSIKAKISTIEPIINEMKSKLTGQ